MNPGNQAPKNLIDIFTELTSRETQERLSPDTLIGILGLLNLLSILSLLPPQGSLPELRLKNPVEEKPTSGPDMKVLTDALGSLTGKSGQTPDMSSLLNLLGPQLSKLAPAILPALISWLTSQGKKGQAIEAQGQEIKPGSAGTTGAGSQDDSKGGAKG